MQSTIAEIIRNLPIFVGAIAALLTTLVVVVSKMPDTNPLKRILTALCYRLGATLAAGAVAIPLEPIPGIDVLYDIGVPVVLIWYWFTFFTDARRMTSDPSLPVRGKSHMAVDGLDVGVSLSMALARRNVCDCEDFRMPCARFGSGRCRVRRPKTTRKPRVD